MNKNLLIVLCIAINTIPITLISKPPRPINDAFDHDGGDESDNNSPLSSSTSSSPRASSFNAPSSSASVHRGSSRPAWEYDSEEDDSSASTCPPAQSFNAPSSSASVHRGSSWFTPRPFCSCAWRPFGCRVHFHYRPLGWTPHRRPFGWVHHPPLRCTYRKFLAAIMVATAVGAVISWASEDRYYDESVF